MPLPQRFPYHRRAAATVAVFLTAMDIFLAAVIYAVSENWLLTIILAGLFFLVDLFFAISALTTAHEVGEDYIIVRQGWYFKKRIALKDITLVQKVKRGPFSYGMHWLWDSTRYVNGSRDDLILIEENGQDRGGCYRVLFDVLDRDGFLRAMKIDPLKVLEVPELNLSGKEKKGG
ncbi:MAG: hypothetical protein WCK39_03965 [Methanomassiliicoccales archaeon]